MTKLKKWKHSVVEYKQTKGFTLIELIVVMAIIAVLVLLAAPRFLGRTNDAVAAQIQNDIRVAEDKVMELLVTDDSRVDEWEVVTSDELTGLMDDYTLYGRGGELIEIEEGDFFRQLDDAFISNNINSNLHGQFFITNEGDVLYLGMGGFSQDGPDNNDTTPDEPEPLTYDEWVEVRETEGYVMVTDIDFEKDSNGHWRYVGEDSFVIVPNVIDGETVMSYHSMFKETDVKGVASYESEVTTMNEMFWSSNAETLDLRYLDTSKVRSMQNMFRETSAESLDLSGFDTSKVTSMFYMFYRSNAKTLDLSSFDTRNVTQTSSMLRGASATIGYARTSIDADFLNEVLDIPDGLEFVVHPDIWDQPVNYVLASDDDFTGETTGEFQYRGVNHYVIMPDEIKGVPVLSYAEMFRNSDVRGVVSDNSNIWDMTGTFRDSNAPTLDLSNFDTSAVRSMQNMFRESNSESLDLSGFDTSEVTNTYYMFYRSRVNTLDLSSFDMSNVTRTGSMLRNISATTGYARTADDADLLNNLSLKPDDLNFIIKP